VFISTEYSSRDAGIVDDGDEELSRRRRSERGDAVAAGTGIVVKGDLGAAAVENPEKSPSSLELPSVTWAAKV
jgi:hypothetical protein